MGAGPILALNAVALIMLMCSQSWACSVCFGSKEHPLNEGMKMGVLSLLLVVLIVLGLLAAFFINMAIRSKRIPSG